MIVQLGQSTSATPDLISVDGSFLHNPTLSSGAMAVLDALPAHVAVLDADGIILAVNRAWREFASSFGMTLPGYGVGTNYISICGTASENGAAERREVADGIRSVANGERDAFSLEYPCKCVKECRWYLLRILPIPHALPAALLAAHEDITARKLAELSFVHSQEQLEQRVIQRTAELAQINAMLRQQIAERTRADLKLRESEERFREMADNIREVVWVQDSATGKILYISPAYESVWGRSCQSMYDSAASFLDAVLPDDLPIAIECMRRQAFESYDAVYRIRGRHEEIRWVRSRSSPIRDASGKTLRITGIAEDITDLKTAEAELSRLALIVESSDDAIIGKSLDGAIVSWNSGAERIYGYSAQEMLGRGCGVLVPPQDWPIVVALLKRVGRGERIETFEANRVRKNGSPINISVTLSSVKDSAGNIIGASEIERDVTERKRLEQEVLLISDRERRRIGQDLHDGLGQHLTGIAFLSKSLQQRLASKAISGAAATAEESAEAGCIAELVQQAVGQTRALARGLHPVETSANGLMAALNDLATRVGSYSKVECTFECEASVLVADNVVATHLYRIAQESVTNAIKHANTKRIRIGLHCSDEKLKLIVEDEGVGIPDAAGSPLGLGLRIMRYRAKMIGGTLTIANGEKCGVVVACEVSTVSNCVDPGKKEIP